MSRSFITLDLTREAWSRAGSFLAFSLRDEDDARPWEQRPGDALYLRTVRGSRETDRAFRVQTVTADGASVVACTVEAMPHLLRLRTRQGTVELCLSGPGTVRLRGTGGVGLRLSLSRIGAYGNAQAYDTLGRVVVNACSAHMTFLLSPLTGRLQLDAPAGVLHAERVAADFLPDGAQEWEGVVEEFLTEHVPAPPVLSFDREAEAAAQDFAAFFHAQPSVPEALRSTAERMAYVQWASLVASDGHLTRPAMLMSKNHMASVWSWDHCFNALALMSHAPALAWDQFCLPFDHQDSAGALPDFLNDREIGHGFVKPPIHGWTLRGLMERDKTGFLTRARLSELYEPLARWTRWWQTFRDADGDGVPGYPHGNDSGWDNSTAFDAGFPVESPDLSAYLALQMDLLSEVALLLGRAGEAARWTTESDALLARLMRHSWRGDRFAAPRSDNHTVAADGDSLLCFLPLVLGERLPAECRVPLLSGLRAPNRFLTLYGLATESVASSLYAPDGYWRGPVWAPPVLLIADGLRRMGEGALAGEIAAGFCRAVQKSGAAENFDALTGEGLRDRAYTWTASVFLVFAREYLD